MIHAIKLVLAILLFTMIYCFAIMVQPAQAKPKPKKKHQTVTICPRAMPGHQVCYDIRIKWLR